MAVSELLLLKVSHCYSQAGFGLFTVFAPAFLQTFDASPTLLVLLTIVQQQWRIQKF